MDDAAHLIIPPAHPVRDEPLPRWRVIYEFFNNPLAVYSEQAFEQTYGRMRSLGFDTIGVADPAMIHHVMQANQANYRRPAVQPRLLRWVMGNGVFLAEGDEWRRQRRMLAPTFNPGAVGDLIPHFQTAAELMLARLHGVSQARLTEVFHRAALDAVLKALFSLPGDNGRLGMTGLVRDFLEGAGRPTVWDALSTSESAFAWASGKRRRFQKAWFRIVDDLIAERKAQGGDQSHKRGDLLDLLLAARDPQTGEGLTDAEVRDQCATMLAAGFETTSRLLFWASYLLALDPAEQALAAEEIRAFPPDRVGGMDDLSHWPRLKCVLLEALRLYPPVAYIVRKAIAADNLAGQEITAGTEVWISPFVIHRHRKFWDNPTAFMPQRFAGIASPWTSLEHYVPFGVGPRICIGAGFAMTEAQIVLANLLARYRLVLEDKTPVLPVFRLATVPSHDPLFRLELV
ncbi:MAG: cytochrome P450 [Asticcacaulis sp.]